MPREVDGGLVQPLEYRVASPRASRNGVLQLVVLGAGADSRAYRFQREMAHLAVFEVDHPQTSSWKQDRVRRMLGHLPKYVRYVPVNFGSEALATALEGAGFDSNRRTFFLWEGVTMYLAPHAVDSVLSLVARSPEGSAVAFDYVYEEAIAHPDRFDGATAHTTFVASRGEPFTFGLSPQPNDLASFLAARGLALAKSWDQRELRAVYPGDGFLMPYVGIVHAHVASKGT